MHRLFLESLNHFSVAADMVKRLFTCFVVVWLGASLLCAGCKKSDAPVASSAAGNNKSTLAEQPQSELSLEILTEDHKRIKAMLKSEKLLLSLAGLSFRSTPFSGNERNRIFFRRGDNFEDLTLVSGADFREDGRGFAMLDFDRDGWLDLGIVSPNHPRFRIVKNKIGKLKEGNGFVGVSLVGGQTTSEPSTVWSARDAFGASILVTTGDSQRRFLLSCGEGLSSQNSKRIHIGLGETKLIDSIQVSWPSGKESIRENVKAGQRITIYENQDQAR